MDKELKELIKSGERAGWAFRDKELGIIKVSASDGYIWQLADIADRLFDQMEGKDGWLVFIPKNDVEEDK